MKRKRNKMKKMIKSKIKKKVLLKKSYNYLKPTKKNTKDKKGPA